MLERAREVVQRLLRSTEAPLRKAESSGEHQNGQGSPPDHSDAFDRFLRDYKAHIDEEESAQVRQLQPRTYGLRDWPAAPTRK
jgi:hypothetical protein